MTGDAPAGGGRMADLGPRLLSSVALALIGTAVVVIGGSLMTLVVAAAVGILVWELARLCGSGEAHLLGLASGVSCLFVLLLPDGWGLPFLMLPAFLGIASLNDCKVVFAVFAVLILVSGYGLVHVRDAFGAVWMTWLILVVVVTDIAGYFAGRLIGGPRFWPRLSPKKTWSGTIAGWVAAALVGLGAWHLNGTGGEVVGLSVALSMASQLGDIAESALKRRVGAKDSGAILPGHGGLFDRFDGFLGATILFLMVEQVVHFPPGPAGG